MKNRFIVVAAALEFVSGETVSITPFRIEIAADRISPSIKALPAKLAVLMRFPH